MSIYVKHILTCDRIENNPDDSITIHNSFVHIKGKQLPISKSFYLFVGAVLLSDKVDDCSLVIKRSNGEVIAERGFPIRGEGEGTLDEYVINMGEFLFLNEGVFYFNIYDANKALVAMHRIKVSVEEGA